MDASCSPLATPVSGKTDILCEESRNKSVRGFEKSMEGRRKKTKKERTSPEVYNIPDGSAQVMRYNRHLTRSRMRLMLMNNFPAPEQTMPEG